MDGKGTAVFIPRHDICVAIVFGFAQHLMKLLRKDIRENRVAFIEVLRRLFIAAHRILSSSRLCGREKI